MSNTGTSNKTSSSNNISITFAKWFINKQRSTGIIVDGKDFDFIIAQLDNSTWDEFIAANSDANVDALIPQLVQKMPKKPRAPKKVADDAKPKGKKTRVDAQTSTDVVPDVVATTEGAVIVPEVAEPVVADNKKDKKEVKKRAPKAKKTEEVVVATTECAVIVSEVVSEVVAAKEKKQPKKLAPKAKKTEEVVVPTTEGVEIVPEVVATTEGAKTVSEVIAAKEKKEPKKRAPKAKKNEDVPVNTEVEVPVTTEGAVVAEQTEICVENAPEVVATKEKKEPKKRAPKAKKNEDVPVNTEVEVPVTTTEGAVVVEKKKRGPKKVAEENRAPDEVIIPVQEQSILSEEPYVQEEETVLTEIFVNEVLFYVDSEDNWFDSNLQPTTKQN